MTRPSTTKSKKKKKGYFSSLRAGSSRFTLGGPPRILVLPASCTTRLVSHNKNSHLHCASVFLPVGRGRLHTPLPTRRKHQQLATCDLCVPRQLQSIPGDTFGARASNSATAQRPKSANSNQRRERIQVTPRSRTTTTWRAGPTIRALTSSLRDRCRAAANRCPVSRRSPAAIPAKCAASSARILASRGTSERQKRPTS